MKTLIYTDSSYFEVSDPTAVLGTNVTRLIYDEAAGKIYTFHSTLDLNVWDTDFNLLHAYAGTPDTVVYHAAIGSGKLFYAKGNDLCCRVLSDPDVEIVVETFGSIEHVNYMNGFVYVGESSGIYYNSTRIRRIDADTFSGSWMTGQGSTLNLRKWQMVALPDRSRFVALGNNRVYEFADEDGVLVLTRNSKPLRSTGYLHGNTFRRGARYVHNTRIVVMPSNVPGQFPTFLVYADTLHVIEQRPGSSRPVPAFQQEGQLYQQSGQRLSYVPAHWRASHIENSGVVNFAGDQLLIPALTGVINVLTVSDDHIYLFTRTHFGTVNNNQLLKYSRVDYSLLETIADIRHAIVQPNYAQYTTATNDGEYLVYSNSYWSIPAGHPSPPPLSLVYVRRLDDIHAIRSMDIEEYGFSEAFSSCVHNGYIYITTRSTPDVIVVSAQDFEDFQIIRKPEWNNGWGTRRIKIFKDRIFLTIHIGANQFDLFIYDLEWNLIRRMYMPEDNNIFEPFEEPGGYIRLPSVESGGDYIIDIETLRYYKLTGHDGHPGASGYKLYIDNVGGRLAGLYSVKTEFQPRHILHRV